MMKKPSKFEAAYDSLARIGRSSISDDAKAELKQALGTSKSLLVSKASDIVGQKALDELIPDMIAAFERFMVDGAKSDKQCSAKTSIVNALNKLEYAGVSVFLKGAYYIQMEPAFGPPVDTAGELRSGCAFALARLEHPDAHYTLTDLLTDGGKMVRIAAAKALSYLGSRESELLLRFKVLTGDRESDVISECFTGLMTMTPDRSLDFVARYISSPEPAISECAALAIGSSKLPVAYDVLRQCWDDDISPAKRQRLLLPIALVRSTEALDFLLSVLRNSNIEMAIRCLSALSIYVDDDSISKIRDIVKSQHNPDLTRAFQSAFGQRIS